MSFLDECKKHFEGGMEMCAKCRNLEHITRALLGCKARDCLILTDYPPWGNVEQCRYFAPRIPPYENGLIVNYKQYLNGTTMVYESFLLQPDRDPAARAALKVYADTTHDKWIRYDILKWLGEATEADKPKSRLADFMLPAEVAPTDPREEPLEGRQI